MGRADLKAEIAANAKEIAAEIQGAVAADAAAQKALGDETAKALEKTNKDITAYSDQMRAIALKTRADIKATNEKTLAAIKEEEERANGAIENFTAEDAARQEESMTDKGVLQVDKVEGKPGNFVFINGRSVGLSNKLSDFSTLAAKMTMYESVLAKMTSKITAPPAAAEQKPYMVPDTAFDEDAWPGN